jgi:hypothetical protein
VNSSHASPTRSPAELGPDLSSVAVRFRCCDIPPYRNPRMSDMRIFIMMRTLSCSDYAGYYCACQSQPSRTTCSAPMCATTDDCEINLVLLELSFGVTTQPLEKGASAKFAIYLCSRMDFSGPHKTDRGFATTCTGSFSRVFSMLVVPAVDDRMRQISQSERVRPKSWAVGLLTRLSEFTLQRTYLIHIIGTQHLLFR